MRKVRPTFLLRCVVLATSVVFFLLVLKFSTSVPITGGAILFLIAFWILGIECELLPLLLENILVKKAQRAKRVDSLWFVDVDEERKREFDDHSEGTSDNPTIR